MYLDPDFPMDDIRLIASDLESANNLIPGFVPPDAGLLSVAAMYYAAEVDKQELFLLPDRNVVTRIAGIARDGMPKSVDLPTALSAKVMAYAQCLSLQFEPSIAYHELAHSKGNAVAIDELRWFRKGDVSQPQAWVDLALGRRKVIDQIDVEVEVERDLAFPLHRWRRNYLVSLKIAELELKDTQPISRVLDLFNWMQEDFLIAGPALIFATMYFAPKSPKRNMLKQLKSRDRSRAISGIRNAAWDITHLSDFVKRVLEGNEQNRRYILVTADKAMGTLAPLLLWNFDDEEDLIEPLVFRLQEWWPQKEAVSIAENMVAPLKIASGKSERKRPNFDNGTLDEWTVRAEEKILNWRPS
ncbi:hypothetical protein [Roseibium alexandrii]|uniref:Uncharacterized protein n=1 Tax=Roseibium alexandrii TaxID=388408 RepID=A0A0M7AJM1_9HYPH|nr:hypothetical protein [Roseibium alexandrii]CTQ74837.1 hypothetical protein LAX5112_03996 [Roseibium alexandrii]